MGQDWGAMGLELGAGAGNCRAHTLCSTGQSGGGTMRCPLPLLALVWGEKPLSLGSSGTQGPGHQDCAGSAREPIWTWDRARWAEPPAPPSP